LCTLLVFTSAGRPFAQWVKSNAQLIGNDQHVATIGLILRDATAANASIAVYQAGSTPYFARRRAIDMLGKNDKHIAAMRSDVFYPGHDKEDLAYSLTGRPDVVVTLGEASAEVRSALEQFGYTRACAAMWVRADTNLVDRATLDRRCL